MVRRSAIVLLRQPKDDRRSATWQTAVKEIIERAIIIHPAFCSEMTSVTDQESRVFIVRLKFSYGKVVLFHKCSQLCVIVVASRARNPRVVVKISRNRHAEN